jgi:hypothetical protein
MIQQIKTLEEHLEQAKKSSLEKEAALHSQLSSVTVEKQTTEEELVSLLIMKHKVFSSQSTACER